MPRPVHLLELLRRVDLGLRIGGLRNRVNLLSGLDQIRAVHLLNCKRLFGDMRDVVQIFPAGDLFERPENLLVLLRKWLI